MLDKTIVVETAALHKHSHLIYYIFSKKDNIIGHLFNENGFNIEMIVRDCFAV